MCSEPGFGGKRLRLSDDDRRRLAVKAQALSREALAQIASVATPATLLRWYRHSPRVHRWDNLGSKRGVDEAGGKKPH